MPYRAPMPNYARALTAAGLDALRDAVASFAPWQLLGPVDATTPDAAALAASLAARLKHPEHVFGALPFDAQDRVAIALGLADYATWAATVDALDAEEGERDYAWERRVGELLYVRAPTPPSEPRRDVAPRHAHAHRWPELADAAAWAAVDDRDAVTQALARALGPTWEALAPTATRGLPRVRDAARDLVFFAVPGGAYGMGVTPDEQRDIEARLAGDDPEGLAFVRHTADAARPTREVTVAPFLCAEVPLGARAAEAFGVSGSETHAHLVRLDAFDAETVRAAAPDLRLLAEAEWEWIARSSTTGPWLHGDEAADAWARSVHAAGPAGRPGALGIAALGWGEWVDDGWHPTYEGAPAEALAWEPRTRPEVVRAGALELFPWQSPGEPLLCHVAVRGRVRPTSLYALRLARDLPER